jgi:uncharacterized membrane protein YfcA
MNDSSSYLTLFVFFLLTLISEILGTIGGFGSSIFTVSFLQFIFSFESVLIITGMLHVFSNTFKIILFLKTIDWRLVLWLGVSSILFSIAGAYLIKFANQEYLKITLGVFLLGFSVFFFLNPTVAVAATLKNSVVGGSVAGFLAGFVGTGGALRGLVMAAFNLEKNFFVGTSAAIDWGVDVSRTWIYINNQYFKTEMIWYLPLLALAALAGSYLGKRILNYISQELFKKIILALIGMTGAIMIAQQALVN